MSSNHALVRTVRFLVVILVLLLVVLSAGCMASGGEEAETEPRQSAVPPRSAETGEETAGYATYCADAEGCPEGGVPSSLRRPLKIPQLSFGRPCPVGDSRQVSPAFAPALGAGPVYPVGFDSEAALTFEYPPGPKSQFAGSQWGGAKTLWVGDPDYTGPILIRGRQVDGSSPLRFDVGGAQLLDELQLPPDYASNYSGGWRNFPSHTRLRAPGCYAYQVDGSTFSIVIVFKAAATSPPGEALTTNKAVDLESGRSSARFSLLAPDPPRHSFTVEAEITPPDAKLSIDIATWYGQTLHVLRAESMGSWCELTVDRARCHLPLPALEAQHAGPWTVIVQKRSAPPATARVRVTFEPLSP